MSGANRSPARSASATACSLKKRRSHQVMVEYRTMNKLLSTYDLTRTPFSKDIPASELLHTEALELALERLKAALEGRASAVVTGDSGCGKTCLLRALEENLPQGRYR